MILIDRYSIRPKKVIPNSLTSDQRFRDNNEPMPKTQARPPVYAAARTRVNPFRSTSQAVAGSRSEMAEVQAANINNKKNSRPTIFPMGILPKAIGNTLKIRPAPAS